jgi:hypothetical protein
VRAALVFLVACAGCLEDIGPQVGAPVAALCSNDDENTSSTVSFARDIQPIFDARCKACHYPTGFAPIGLQVTGLNLSSYQTVIAGAIAGAVVVPDEPCASVLYLKVTPGPPFGSRMPLNGPPFLTAGDIQLIHDWIAEGAVAN